MPIPPFVHVLKYLEAIISNDLQESLSKANPKLASWYYGSAEEIAQYGYIPDYAYLGTKKNEWNERWEKEVVPLIRS